MQFHIHTKPQIPDFIGDISMTPSKMFMTTRIKTTSIPNLPGYAVGGTRKLNQLTKTMIKVGKYVCTRYLSICL